MGITSNNVAAINAANSSSGPQHSSSLAQPKTLQGNKSAAESVPAIPAVTPPSTDRILISNLEGANEEIRIVARQIREVDQTMDAIAQNLEKMTTALEGIVKSYPPYPQGSQERVAALRQFAGLRQLIDQLTFPPPDDTTGKILGDKKMYPDAGDWKFPAGNGQALVTIGHQPVHAGADGLDLPELSTDASDEAVRRAFGRMKKSQERLQRRRGAFTAEANRAMAALL